MAALLAAWKYAEASNANYNPWDCTAYCPGAWPYNTFDGGRLHVWNYPTELDGIFIFLATFHSNEPGYAAIRQAIIANDPYAAERAISRSAWGTEPFAATLAAVLANPDHYLDLILPYSPAHL